MATTDRNEIGRLIEAAKSFSTQNDSDAALFLGHSTDPIPRALIRDTDLSLAARLLWCYFRSLSNSPGSPALSPDYETIMKEVGIRRRNTISESLTALWITRWMTVITMPGTSGRRVYLVYDIPLEFPEVIELDPRYPDRITRAAGSNNKKLSDLARRVLDGVMQNTHSATTNSGLSRLAVHLPGEDSDRGAVVQSMWKRTLLRAPPAEAGHETTPSPEPTDSKELEFHDGILSITDVMKKIVTTRLGFIPAEFRQLLLDDIAVRMLEQADSEKPVRDPVSYLSWAVNRYRTTGDLPLSGKAERLQDILAARQREERKRQQGPIKQELTRLNGEFAHTQTMISRCTAQGIELDEWLVNSLDDLGARIGKLKAMLPAGEDVDE